MSAEQYGRNFPAVVDGGAGIYRSTEQAVLEGVGKCGLLVADSSRDEADDGVGDDGGGELAAGEDIVADGNLASDEVVADALVDALVVAAEDDDVVQQAEGVGHWLREELAVGSGEDDFVVVTLGFQRGDAGVDGLYLHDHSGLAAEGVVVDLAVLVGGVVAQVVDVNLGQALLPGAPEDGAAQGALEHFGHDGEYVYTHGAKLLINNGAYKRKPGTRLADAPPGIR